MVRPHPALAVALVVTACSGQADPAPWDDADCARALEDSHHAPAAEWLKDPFGGPKSVGRLSTEEALALVDALEMRGATRIEAVGIATRQGPGPSQTCPGLVVGMPLDPARRTAVFRLYAKIVSEAGYKARGDEGQRFLYVVARPR